MNLEQRRGVAYSLVAFRMHQFNIDIMRKARQWARRILAACFLLGAFSVKAGSQPGAVVAWGDNIYGLTNIPPGLTNVVAIATGTYHYLALQSNGTVVAWGYNGSGQTNVPPGLSNVVAVSAGDQNGLALQRDGTVVGWGANFYGQNDVPPGVSNIMAIAAGGSLSMVLQSNGTVVSWGNAGRGQAAAPPGLSNVVAIAAGFSHCLALRGDGTVVAWGDYFWGQTYVPPGLSNVVAIAAGQYHSLALQSSGTVVAWGQMLYGQTTVPAGLNNVVAVAGGDSFSDALLKDGTVVAWGRFQTNVPSGLNDVVAIAAGPAHSLSITLAPFLASKPLPAISLAKGAGTNLSVTVSSASSYTSQWSLNGRSILGATGTQLVISNFDLTNAGAYSVVITNQHGDFTSALSVLRLTNSPVILVDGVDVGGGTVARTNVPSITMSSSFGTNANIFYTLDGTEPSYTSIPYNGAFHLASTSTIRAIAYDSAYLSSAEAAPITVTIPIPPLYPLTATTPGGGSVNFSPPPYGGGNLFVSNTQVTLAASPSNGWSFLGWLGDASGTNPVVALSINHGMAVEAIFGTTIISNVLGPGQIQFSPEAPVYPFGTIVGVTAIPQTGDFFLHWAGALSGSNNPNVIMMTTTNPVVTALFEALAAGQFALTVVPQGAGSVATSSSNNVFSPGTVITLTAVPSHGQSFIGWSGDAIGSQNPLSVTMNQSKVITAGFTRHAALSTSPPLNGVVEQGFRFSLIGGMGASFRIDGSADLKSWIPLGWVTNNLGTSQFLDTAAVTNPLRFYRAVAQ